MSAKFNGKFQLLPEKIVREAANMLEKTGAIAAAKIDLKTVGSDKIKNIPGFTGIDLLLWAYMKTEFAYEPYEMVTGDNIPLMGVLYKDENEMVLADIRGYVLSAMEDSENTWKERIVQLKQAWQATKRKAKEDGIITTISHVDYEGISPVNFLIVEGFNPDPSQVEILNEGGDEQ